MLATSRIQIVEGLLRCAETPGFEGERYILAGKNPVPFSHLMQMIATALNVEIPPSWLPAVPLCALFHLGDVAYRRLGMVVPKAHAAEFFLANRNVSIAKAQRDLI